MGFNLVLGKLRGIPGCVHSVYAQAFGERAELRSGGFQRFAGFIRKFVRADRCGLEGIGGGIDYLEDDQGQSEAGDASSKKPAAEQYDDTAEPGHGGNETDMEHRRRPKLERRSD